MRDMIVFKRFWLAIAIELSFRSLWNQIYKGAQLHTLARSISDMILLSCASNNDERQQPRNANKNTHTHTQANQSLQIWNSMLFAAWHSFNTHQESFRALIYVTLCIAGESYKKNCKCVWGNWIYTVFCLCGSRLIWISLVACTAVCCAIYTDDKLIIYWSFNGWIIVGDTAFRQPHSRRLDISPNGTWEYHRPNDYR